MTIYQNQVDEFCRIEATLGSALDELSERMKTGLTGPDTDDLAQHCHEMGDILAEAIGKLDTSPQADAIRGKHVGTRDAKRWMIRPGHPARRIVPGHRVRMNGSGRVMRCLPGVRKDGGRCVEQRGQDGEEPS